MFRLLCVAFWLFMIMLKFFGIIVMPLWFVMLPVIGYVSLWFVMVALGALLAVAGINLND